MTTYQFIISLQDLETPLQGRIRGMRHYTDVCVQLTDAPHGTLVLLDFSGINHVTGSWINSMIVPLFRWAALSENDVFPILYNVKDEWLDDFRLIAQWNHQCYLVTQSRTFPPQQALLVGLLGPAQKTSFEVVRTEGSVTGAQLQRNVQGEIGATAWNNRLKELYQKRLIRREKRGRQQLYYPIVKEIKDNGR